MCAKEASSVELHSSKNSSVQLTYETAIKQDDVLTLFAGYSGNESFEIIRDIVVSADENFDTILPSGACKIEKLYTSYEISPVATSLHSDT